MAIAAMRVHTDSYRKALDTKRCEFPTSGIRFFIMYFVYILYSKKLDRYYIGYSSDPEKRLKERHNQGKVKATRSGFPYALMAKKRFETEIEAIREERRLKKAKNREYIEYLIKGNW